MEMHNDQIRSAADDDDTLCLESESEESGVIRILTCSEDGDSLGVHFLFHLCFGSKVELTMRKTDFELYHYRQYRRYNPTLVVETFVLKN
jgi:hypothetical protein